MWPENWVCAAPEFFGECVKVGADHGFYTGVDDGEGVVGPEVAPNIGKVLIFKEEFVTEAAVEHEFCLFSQELVGGKMD